MNTQKAKSNKGSVRSKPSKTGRPTKYKKEFNIAVRVITEKGFTDLEIASTFGVSKTTVNKWKKDYPEFLASLKAGKKIADDQVVRALFQRATGYSHPDIHITNHKGKITITPIIKHYAPEVTACIYWTKNRMPDEWSDRKEVNLSGEVILKPPKIG